MASGEGRVWELGLPLSYRRQQQTALWLQPPGEARAVRLTSPELFFKMTPERQTVLTARLVAGLLCALFASGYSPVQERLGLRPPRPQAQGPLCINHQERASERGCFNRTREA